MKPIQILKMTTRIYLKKMFSQKTSSLILKEIFISKEIQEPVKETYNEMAMRVFHKNGKMRFF